jgi:hypothetical protein
VNPFLISNPFLKGDDSLLDSANDDDVCGWCVFDSVSTNSQEKTDDGFHGTFYTKHNSSLGVRLFFNICASYLKSKRKSDGNEGKDGGEADELKYEEPFGEYNCDMGCSEFIRSDYTSPNIILRHNSNDCGFAAVANEMTCVLQMRNVPFTGHDIDHYDPSEHQPTMTVVNVYQNWHKSMKAGGVKKFPCYVMKKSIYSLKPFWDQPMLDAES